MKKGILILTSSLILIIVIILTKPIFISYRNTDTLTNRLGIRLFELNTITVNVDEGLNLNDFVIKNLNNGKVVFKNGHQTNRIKNEYGWSRFEFIYKGIIIAEIGDNKRNNWYTNDYVFTIQNINGFPNILTEINSQENWKSMFFKKEYTRDSQNILLQFEYYNCIDSLYNVSKLD